MDIERRLTSLRKELRERSIDAYLVTGTDPHQSEYVAPRWRTRAFISGFTGSAGTVVVTQDKAVHLNLKSFILDRTHVAIIASISHGVR